MFAKKYFPRKYYPDKYFPGRGGQKLDGIIRIRRHKRVELSARLALSLINLSGALSSTLRLVATLKAPAPTLHGALTDSGAGFQRFMRRLQAEDEELLLML